MSNSDVLIIGGGVIGLSIARELNRKGARKITVLERGSLGREASFAAAGMLAPNAENDSHDDLYDLCVASRELYSEFAASLLAETDVDIELERSGTLYLGFDDEDSKELHSRFAWQKHEGVSVEHLSATETLQAEPLVSRSVRESLFYPDDWQVENRKMLTALSRYAELNGIHIADQTEVRSLWTEGGSVIGAKTDGGSFSAGVTILATGAWTSLIKINEVAVPVEVTPIRGQMISFHPPDKMFQKVIYSPRGYLVPRSDGRILVGATSENVGFDKSVTEAGSEKLLRSAIEISPGLSGHSIADQWAGLRPYGGDGLPVLGPVTGFDGLFVATAHYRNGILLAPITARLIGESVVDGSKARYLEIFGISRKLSVNNAVR